MIAIGILITIHAFGHFWFVRRRGVHVERFCVGFGRTLRSHTDRQSTERVIATIPLGRHVKIFSEEVKSVPPMRCKKVFNNKPIWQCAVIISTGPGANFLFTFLVYWILCIIGASTFRLVIADDSPYSIAEKSEILPGMEFKSVNGIKAPDWESVRLARAKTIGDTQAEVGVASFNFSKEIVKTLDLRQ